jgi:MFS family permease
MSSVNAMDPFHDYFGVGMEGASIGAVFALYSVGNIIGCFFAAPAADLLGRRKGMALGAAISIVGATVQSAAKNVGTLMAGRLILGIGTSVSMTSAPMYLVEMSYPPWRGLFTGLFNVLGWYIGSLCMIVLPFTLSLVRLGHKLTHSLQPPHGYPTAPAA